MHLVEYTSEYLLGTIESHRFVLKSSEYSQQQDGVCEINSR